MKNTLLILVLLFFAVPITAQQTTVTGTVLDPTGKPYRNCSITANYVDAPPGPGVTRAATINGSPLTSRSIATSCDSNANFTLLLYDTTVISYGGQFGGGTWQFTVSLTIQGAANPPFTGQPISPTFSYTAPICPVAGCVTGATLNITAALQVVSIPLPATGGGGGGGTPGGANTQAQVNSNNTFAGTPCLTFPNISVAPVVIGCDPQINGPDPYVDVRQYGLVSGTASTTATITAGSAIAAVASGTGFANGNGFVLYGAGPANTMSTPAAPTVTASQAANYTSIGSGPTVAAPAGGVNTFSYQLMADDCAGGLTPASAVGSTTTGFPLGQQTTTITSYTRSGTLVTAMTSSAHGLAPGALIETSTTAGADTTLTGWFQVVTTPSSTTFTFNSGFSTAGNPPAPVSGTPTVTVYFYNVNHLTWAAPGGTLPCRYWVYGRTGGTLTALGVSEISNANGMTSLTFNDYGSPYNDNFNFPAYIPTNPPVSATNDWLVGTVVSGGGTTSLTLSLTANTNVTNGTFQLDNAVPFESASAANCNGAPLYIPSGQNFIFNSTMTLPCGTAIQQAGTITLNEPWILGNSLRWWRGDLNPQAWSLSTSQIEPAPPVIIKAANPGVYAYPAAPLNITHVAFQSTNLNASRLMIIDPNAFSTPIPSGEISHSSFLTSGSTDYMSQGLILRGTAINAITNFKMDEPSFLSGPNQIIAPPTPNLQITGNVIHIHRPFFTRRTLALVGFSQVDIDGLGYDSGGIMPAYWVNSNGSNPLSIANLQLDTTTFAVGNFSSVVGGNAWQGTLILKDINVAGASNLTGAPFNNVVVTGSAGLLGQNVNICTQTGSLSCSGSSGVQSSGPGDLGYALAAPAAPAIVVGAHSSCASNCLPAGTYFYAIMAQDATNRNSPLGAFSTGAVTDGTQSITVTITPVPGQASTIEARGATSTSNVLLCGIPGPGGSGAFQGTSFVDTPAGPGLVGCSVSNTYPTPGNASGFDSTGVAAPQVTLVNGTFKNVLSGAFTANRATTFPDNGGPVAELNFAQTWTTNQTFANGFSQRFFGPNGVNYVGFTGPGSNPASNVNWALPSADSAGCFQSNGSGTVSIASCGGGAGSAPGGAAKNIQYQINATTFGGSSNGNYTAATGVFDFSQFANTNETITGHRFTDTTPTGNLLHFQNAALNADLFKLDVLGNLTIPATLTANAATFTAALTVPNGGTGVATLGIGQLLNGNGTSPIQSIAGTLAGTNPILTITAQSASAVPLTLNTAASPTGDLADFQVVGVKTSWVDKGAIFNAPAFNLTGSGPNVVSGPEGTCPSPVSGSDILCLGDSASHSALLCLNGTSCKPAADWLNTSPNAHGIVVAISTGSFPQQNAIMACGTGITVVGQGSSADPICAILGAVGGGLGTATNTAHGVLLGEGTSPVNATSAGTAGQPFLYGGASADGGPGALNLAGGSSIITGVCPIANGCTGSSTLAGASIATVTGTITPGDCVKFSAATVITDATVTCGGGGGTPALSSITAATAANTIANGGNAQTWNCTTTGSTVCMKFGESAASTGTSNVILQVATASGSTAAPFQALNNGNGVSVSSTGVLAKAGTGSVNADAINGTAFSGTNGDLVSFGASNTPADSAILATNVATAASNATGAKQLWTSGGANKTLVAIDFPDAKIVPAANCNNATAGPGWSIPASNAPTILCGAAITTAYTNNLGGFLGWANNNTTTNAQFSIELPNDWDTTAQPFINIYYGSGENTAGTVKWTFSSACTKADGSITADPAFVAESATAGKTMAVKNRSWGESLQFTAMTSGNNCVAGSNVIIKVTSGNGTATSVVNVDKVIITIPRLLTVQAN